VTDQLEFRAASAYSTAHITGISSKPPFVSVSVKNRGFLDLSWMSALCDIIAARERERD
jgi:hypothetical protein